MSELTQLKAKAMNDHINFNFSVFKISRELSYFETLLMAAEKKIFVNEHNPSVKYGSRSCTERGSFTVHHRCCTLRICGTRVLSENRNNTH